MSERWEQVLEAVAGRPVSSTGWARGNCPFCSLNRGKEDRSQSLGLHVDSGDFHCFKCFERGIVQHVPEDLETRAKATRVADELQEKISLPEEYLPLWGSKTLAHDRPKSARKYLAERRVSEQVALEAEIGVCVSGRYGGRIIVPIKDRRGELAGFSARCYQRDRQAGPKYLYPPGMNRRELLFNIAALWDRSANDRPVYVVEGVFDALALWPDAVACLGKPSEAQVTQLAEVEDRPIVCALDGDAWREAEALALKLRVRGRRVLWMRLPPKEDPGSRPEFVRETARAMIAAGHGS